MERKFRFGIFDLDGTLVNSIPTYAETFREILEDKFAISGKEVEEYYLNSTGTPLEEQFAHVLMANGKPTDKIAEMTREFFDIVNRKDFV
ncbi:MAG: HAD hydrolase-like protein, partial [Candidatus Paceibacterota bacterium]